LSEFAGAAAELTGAYLVNPHHLDEVKNALAGADGGVPRRGPSFGGRDPYCSTGTNLGLFMCRIGRETRRWPELGRAITAVVRRARGTP
ncbi:hypothetical protein ACWDY4_41475, partial [Streptomyces olivaceoviridis]